MAVILLVLGAVHPRIIGAHKQQAAADAGVGKCHQRICGYIDSHMLHRHQHPRSRQRGTDTHLQGHLFVGCPVGAQPRKAGELL